MTSTTPPSPDHRFQLPARSHWKDVREPENLGLARQNAMRAFQMANPESLYGIFGDTNWSNKSGLQTGYCGT